MVHCPRQSISKLRFSVSGRSSISHFLGSQERWRRLSTRLGSNLDAPTLRSWQIKNKRLLTEPEKGVVRTSPSPMRTDMAVRQCLLLRSFKVRTSYPIVEEFFQKNEAHHCGAPSDDLCDENMDQYQMLIRRYSHTYQVTLVSNTRVLSKSKIWRLCTDHFLPLASA